jgi:uncharacterized membrane protein
MKSRAVIQDHPIHPMLVSLPIGLWAASLVGDVGYALSGNAFLYDAAEWIMGLGVLAALVAAIPGLIDYFAVAQHHSRTARTAFVHGALNLTIATMYAVNWVLHASGAQYGAPLALAVILNLVAFAMLASSGWLGAELVYRMGMGISRRDLRITMLDEERVPSEALKGGQPTDRY